MAHNGKQNIELSIIIVSYNNFDLLSNALVSIYKTLENIEFETIVVDNASTESGLENAVKGFPNLTLIQNNENRGFAAANNIGAKNARGEFLLLLNNDAELRENFIEKMMNFLANKNMAIAAPKLIFPDGSYQISAYKFPTLWRLFSSSFFLEKIFPKNDFFNRIYYGIEYKTEPQKVDAVIGAFMLIKKNVYEELGGFDERFFFYHEDTDLCFRLASKGGAVYYFPQDTAMHVGGGTTKALEWFQLKNKVAARLKFFRFHYSYSVYLAATAIEKSGNLLRGVVRFLLGVFTLSKRNLILAGYYFKSLFVTWKSS